MYFIKLRLSIWWPTYDITATRHSSLLIFGKWVQVMLLVVAGCGRIRSCQLLLLLFGVRCAKLGESEETLSVQRPQSHTTDLGKEEEDKTVGYKKRKSRSCQLRYIGRITASSGQSSTQAVWVDPLLGDPGHRGLLLNPHKTRVLMLSRYKSFTGKSCLVSVITELPGYLRQFWNKNKNILKVILSLYTFYILNHFVFIIVNGKWTDNNKFHCKFFLVFCAKIYLAK